MRKKGKNKTSIDLIKKHLSKTFYVGLNSEKRLKMLVEHWQRTITVNHELELEIKQMNRSKDVK